MPEKANRSWTSSWPTNDRDQKNILKEEEEEELEKKEEEDNSFISPPSAFFFGRVPVG